MLEPRWVISVGSCAVVMMMETVVCACVCVSDQMLESRWVISMGSCAVMIVMMTGTVACMGVCACMTRCWSLAG